MRLVMSSKPEIDPELGAVLRDSILAYPDVILDDKDVMQALITANDKAKGGNIVDLRGIAMVRLEDRLDRLEDTHRTVIAAAYENLAGTNQIHRAILRLMDPVDFETFLKDLGGEVADTMGVDAMHLVLETAQEEDDPTVQRLGDVLRVVEPGFVAAYFDGHRTSPARQVILRQVEEAPEFLYGGKADWIQSEACLRLDFGAGRLPGMLLLGSEDPQQFIPQHGTDLLAFFAGVFERTMRRWLS
tara:strand:- start:64152 stop:64883 length:732 start_codon:yes stop_codon:yes gene_type:complete